MVSIERFPNLNYHSEGKMLEALTYQWVYSAAFAFFHFGPCGENIKAVDSVPRATVRYLRCLPGFQLLHSDILHSKLIAEITKTNPAKLRTMISPNASVCSQRSINNKFLRRSRRFHFITFGNQEKATLRTSTSFGPFCTSQIMDCNAAFSGLKTTTLQTLLNAFSGKFDRCVFASFVDSASGGGSVKRY